MKTATQIAEYEAKIVAAQASVKEIREGVYSVPSSREGVKPHIIITDENGVANYCTCEHFEHNGWTRDGHKCYHGQAVERFVAAQKAVVQAEEIIAEAAKTPEEIKTESQIESYVRQGVSRSTAEAIVLAKGVKSHGNAKAFEPRAFSLLK